MPHTQNHTKLKKKEKEKDLRLPLLHIALTKEHYFSGARALHKKMIFLQKTAVVGERHKVKYMLL